MNAPGLHHWRFDLPSRFPESTGLGRMYINVYSVCVCVSPCSKGFSLHARIQECRGCKQPIQSCANEDTGCVLVKLIQDAGSTYLHVTPLHFSITYTSPRSCAAEQTLTVFHTSSPTTNFPSHTPQTGLQPFSPYVPGPFTVQLATAPSILPP